MSSDNGTYVLQTYGPEFRVAQLSGVEDLYEEMDPKTLKWSPNIKKVFECFKDAKIFAELEPAWDAAEGLESVKPTEFGVSLSREFETLKFADIKAEYEALFP